MALLSKFQDRQAIVVDGLTLNEPKTKEVAKVFRAIRRPDLSEAEAAESVGETKVKARRRTLERRSILFGLPAHNPVLHSERPQHRRGQGRPGGRVQHLRHPETALPGPHPRGPDRPQGAGQAQAGPARRLDAASRAPPAHSTES